MIHYKVIDRVGDKVLIQEVNSSVVEECIMLENIGRDDITLYDILGKLLATDAPISNSQLKIGFDFYVDSVVPLSVFV